MKKTIAQQLGVTDFPFVIKDKDGNVIYYERSDNLWQKSEYDSNGNKRYCEWSHNFWVRRERDLNGNQIYYEDSNKYCKRYEYDNRRLIIPPNTNSEGDRIYFENSDGVLRDNRPKETIIVNGIKYQRID